MEVSALRYSGGIGVHAKSPLLRLQSDERLIALTRRGNQTAFEVLVSRYHARLLAFCRHLLGSREDAEDVLQEVFAAAFNAMVADERPINVRPWLYRIARNRSLNHLRRAQAIGVDSMDVHFSEHGASTADKVHDREQFRQLVGDIRELPETQRTALILREMDALSYEQIAEAMDTTVPGVKSLLVRARISLAEAAEARQLSCDEVRIELAEVAEGLVRRPSSLVRRHMRTCKRCTSFQSQLKQTNKALAALLPLGPLVLIKKLLITHLGGSAGTGSGAAGATGATVGTGAVGTTGAGGAAGAAGATAAVGSAGGAISAGAGALAGKAAAGLAAAIVTVGAVEAGHGRLHHHVRPAIVAAAPSLTGRSDVADAPAASIARAKAATVSRIAAAQHHKGHHLAKNKAKAHDKALDAKRLKQTAAALKAKKLTAGVLTTATKTPPGRTDTQSDPTVLPSGSGTASGQGSTDIGPPPGASSSTGSSTSSGSTGSTGSGSSSSSSTGSGSTGSGSSSGSSSSTGSGGSGSTSGSGTTGHTTAPPASSPQSTAPSSTTQGATPPA